MLHNDTYPPAAILEQAPHSLPAREETTASGSCTRPSGIAAKESMQDFMAITKALADENRVRILLALRSGELCVCQIVELVQLATSTVSRHMSVLKQAGLAESRKDGRWMYYRLPGVDASQLVRRAIEWVSSMLADDCSVRCDAKRLGEICSLDPHKLCAAQTNGKHSCNHNEALSSEEKPCSG
ncbi:MAG: metalloregulator ArsR/SmtB family transcription factor [Thermoguttaceae bacterium]|jgi:DNA-binding transcriptional ArsR family regulator|nr:metalloregulator ArsR/SmtB family transcription factor [Thermoguttaceae bacterium]